VTNVWAVLPYATVVIGLVAATLWALLGPGLGRRALGFAGAWFFTILAPTSLVPINRQTAAEHRMYLALIPVAVLAVIGLHRRLGRAALPVCLALAAALFAITFRRNEDYRGALTLWADTVAKNPANPWAHNHLGYEWSNVSGRLNDAIAQYGEALRLKPDFAEAHNNLGNALNDEGRTPEAIAQYQEALRLNPDYVGAHNNLGNIWFKMPGRLDDAIAEYGKVLRWEPDSAETRYNLGNALNVAGRTREAIAQYEEVLRLRPEFAEAHNNLGDALEKTPGRLNDAVDQYEEALRLKPGDAIIHLNLAAALLKLPGRGDEAKAHLETVLRLQPDNDIARQILAKIQASRP
jgi:tetratricopeptide (TPR) repeat protein